MEQLDCPNQREVTVAEPWDDRLETQVAQVRGLFDLFVEIGRREGVELIGYDDPRLPLFRALPEPDRNTAAGLLRDYISVLSETQRDHERLTNSLTSVWSMLARLKWRHVNDLFETLKSDDIVEIYTLTGIQVFRSFNFFKCCSYSLEELYTTPWFRLFKRDSAIDRAHIELHERLVSGAISATTRGDIADYEVREHFGRRRYINLAQHRCVSPLYSSRGERVGYIHALRAQVIGTEPSPDAAAPVERN